MWSKCSDASFCMTFAVCVSAAKYVALSLLILPEKLLNRDALEIFDIEVVLTLQQHKKV